MVIEVGEISKNKYIASIDGHKYAIHYAKNHQDAIEKALKQNRLELATRYIMQDKGLDEDRAYALAEDFEKQGLLNDFIGRIWNGNI